MAAAIMWLTLGQANQFGFWTFIVLWWMHTSAKLNVFFGVPNLGAELVPHHMRYLVSFMTRRPMNLFFPLSVTASTICAVHLTGKAMAPGATSFEATGYAMLATLMVLAILEHWFLVTPIDTNGLWKWGVKPERDDDPMGRMQIGALAINGQRLANCPVTLGISRGQGSNCIPATHITPGARERSYGDPIVVFKHRIVDTFRTNLQKIVLIRTQETTVRLRALHGTLRVCKDIGGMAFKGCQQSSSTDQKNAGVPPMIAPGE
jgi:hypothetical protein